MATADDRCFERCACPCFATPDEEGMVVPDYSIAIREGVSDRISRHFGLR